MLTRLLAKSVLEHWNLVGRKVATVVILEPLHFDDVRNIIHVVETKTVPSELVLPGTAILGIILSRDHNGP